MHGDSPPGRDGVPGGPFGYGVCDGCGVAVQRRAAASHACDPERYATHQSSRLDWSVGGFDDALRHWLESPAGQFAQYYARRALRAPASRPGEA